MSEMVDEDAILKRIIKGYLHRKGEATGKQIAAHIQEVGYGLRKQYTKESIAKKIRYWRVNEPTWLRIRWYKNEKRILSFYLEGT